MADLKFVDQHNMVACLEKTEENTEFHQIMDFLSTCSINYALTELMETYTSLTKRVLAVEEAKTVQDRVITRLKLRVKRLEKKRKARTPQPMKRRLFKGRVETSTDKKLEDKGSGEKGGSTADQVSSARLETLIKMKEEKAKEKGVAIKDIEDSPRPIRSITAFQPLPIIDPKDKELAQRLTYKEDVRELDRAQKKDKKQEEATSVALAEEFDEIQARIDVDHELVKLYEREKKWIDDFKPIDDGSQQQAESTKKRPRADSEEESSKKHKLEKDNDAEKEELRDSMDIVPRDDVAINVESLATKYPIINWKTYILNENMMYYQIIRADGSSKNYKIFSEMLDDFDRQDVIDLHRLVNERYDTTSPEGSMIVTLGRMGDCRLICRPNEEDEIWKNQ
ncbi:hypothetical protein Tco_1359318 [Tanacetum coccineum]